MLVPLVMGLLLIAFVSGEPCGSVAPRCPMPFICNSTSGLCVDGTGCSLGCPELPNGPNNLCDEGVCVSNGTGNNCEIVTCGDTREICISPSVGCVPVCTYAGDCQFTKFCVNITNGPIHCGNIPCPNGTGVCGTPFCNSDAECPHFPDPANRCAIGLCQNGVCNARSCEDTNRLDVCGNEQVGCVRKCANNSDCAFNSSLFCRPSASGLLLCQPIPCSSRNGDNEQCPENPYGPANNCSISVCNANNTCEALSCEARNGSCRPGPPQFCLLNPTATPPPTPTDISGCENNTECAESGEHDSYCVDGQCMLVTCNDNSSACDAYLYPFEPNRCFISSCDDGVCSWSSCEDLGQGLTCSLNSSEGCVGTPAPSSQNDTTVGAVALGFVIFFIIVGGILWCCAWATGKRRNRRNNYASV